MPFTARPQQPLSSLPPWPVGHTGQSYSLQEGTTGGQGRDSLEAVLKAGDDSPLLGQELAERNLVCYF